MLVLMFGFALILAATSWEVRTSHLQSWFFSRWSSSARYLIEPGASPTVIYPTSGPFDKQRGYTEIPVFRDRLASRGFSIAEQARQSPALGRLIRSGIAPPFTERPAAGLLIDDTHGTALFDPVAERKVFHRLDDVPPLLLQTLFFIENRKLQDDGAPRENPAIDWQRSARALATYAGRNIGLDLPLEGGSTLATQLEKYRHSRNGRTASPGEKLRQVVGASLAAYHEGTDTREARKQIVLDYLNTMPLSAAPGVGEVNGFGDGLHTWFAMDLAEVSAALREQAITPEKARAYRHALALLYAVHAPTHYLVDDHNALESRVDAYAGLLNSAGVIDAQLLSLVRGTRLGFVADARAGPPSRFVEHKAVNAVRRELAQVLAVPGFYDLDRVDVRVDSTIDGALQEDVTHLLQKLASPEIVAANGLRAPRILERGDPRQVIYSVLLIESRPEGNLIRVDTDTQEAPIGMNEGMKLELGSTAKLRTLAHYLEVMAQLHDELVSLDATALDRRLTPGHDPLTRWAALTLRTEPGLGLELFLDRALDRRYSASPAETFFTGGGVHRFRNFDPRDDRRVVSVREAVVNSTNLAFVRLMRDLVRFHEARLPYDPIAVLERTDSETRERLLAQTADDEAQHVLAREYRRYHDLTRQEILPRLLGRNARSPRHLAMVFYAWRVEAASNTSAAGQRQANAEALADWLQANLEHTTVDQVRRLARAYGNSRLTIADFGYLLHKHPLDLWLTGELARNPQATWEEVLARSQPARRIASAWLFKTHNRDAQDLRLRIQIERDAFARMTPYWRRLGFPFDRLVPSYATAIGSSADRPAALADLMGIIVNDGQLRPAVDIRRLTFGPGTPYHTALERAPPQGERVMRAPVSRLLREVLAEVVARGTARRVNRTFVDEHGVTIEIGGKTGSGDNRVEAFARGGRVVSSRAASRTACFVFYLGSRWFGVVTASVYGPQAAGYGFTSSLPLAVLKLLAPTLEENLRGGNRDSP